MKKRVLFVDDEDKLLDGLRRMLRPLRRELELVFVASGAEALELMAERPFDVVVSDMRMPGMTGAELLDQVRKLYPETVRMVFSGQASAESILRSLGPTHRYLVKPCSAEELQEAVTSALGLSRLLKDERIRGLVGGLGSVPSLPDIYVEIVKELNSPDASVARVAEIISTDAAMTAKTLQLVNSAFFGLRDTVTSPKQAIVHLGLNTIKTLVLSVHVFSAFESTRVERLRLGKLWSHSMRTGNLARRLATDEGEAGDFVDTAYAGGLLHDLGKLVLAASAPDDYSAILKRAVAERITTEEAELDGFGTTHAEVGAYLLGLWGLPDRLTEVLAFHHHPRAYADRGFTPVLAVHVADALDYMGDGDEPGPAPPELDLEYLGEHGLDDRPERWRAAAESERGRMNDDQSA